jgi:uncharacterized damage-inducible protein DinB
MTPSKSVESVEQVEDALRAARQRLLESVRDLPADLVRRRPNDAEWSILEVLAHLVDVDYFYLGEALAMKDREDYLFRYFDDEDWKRHPAVPEESIEDILKRLQESQQAVFQGLRAMTPHDLARPGRHPRGISYTVVQVFLRLPPHDAAHEDQIKRALARL